MLDDKNKRWKKFKFEFAKQENERKKILHVVP